MSKVNSKNHATFSTILIYNLPVVGFGFMYMLFSMYFMKFATDILYLSPALIGMAFGLARLWDAVTNPIAGYLSDRTHHRMGRRRPWLLYSAVPIGLAFVMSFAPPSFLNEGERTVWVIASVFAFYTAVAAFVVPHMSLGAELSCGDGTRNQLFGFRYGALALGYMIGLGGITLLIQSESVGISEARELAFQLTLAGAAVMVLCLVVVAFGVRERAEFQDRGGRGPFYAFADVLKNEHARQLLFVTLLENTGLAVTGVMTFYVTEYVFKAPQYGPVLLLVWLIFSLVGIPFWLRRARRFGKRNAWMVSMLVSAVSYGSLIFLGQGDVAFLMLVMIVSGFAAACGGSVSPALQADVIDIDEGRTGERKEGTYFACWNFVVKGAGGIAVLLAGFVLHWSGFVPKVEQTTIASNAMLGFMALAPLMFYSTGALVLRGWKLEEVAETNKGAARPDHFSGSSRSPMKSTR